MSVSFNLRAVTYVLVENADDHGRVVVAFNDGSDAVSVTFDSFGEAAEVRCKVVDQLIDLGKYIGDKPYWYTIV